MDATTTTLHSWIAIAISLLALAVSIFRPAIERWYNNSRGTQAIATYQYIEYPDPKGRIGSSFVLMTIENATDRPVTIESLEWRLRGTGVAIAGQNTIAQYDEWKSTDLPVVLPTRHAYAKWYHPTSISGEPSWEMAFVDQVLSRNRWRTEYRKLALYFVVSPNHAFDADMPDAFYRRIKQACELWDAHGWPQERIAAASNPDRYEGPKV